MKKKTTEKELVLIKKAIKDAKSLLKKYRKELPIEEWLKVYFSTKKLPTNLTPKKRAFLDIFKAKGAFISVSCDACNISRQTYYDWLEADKEFRNCVNEIKESVLDFTEHMLIKNIQEGKEASIIFKLKTLGKSRGYIEKQEVEHSGSLGMYRALQEMSDEELQKLVEQKKLEV